MKIKNLTLRDFEEVLDTNLSALVTKKIQSYNFAYEEIDKKERDRTILKTIEFLNSDFVQKSGPHRVNDWVEGWAENEKEFTNSNNFSSLIPKYFGKFPYVRWKQNFIKPLNPDFEYNMVKVLQYWLFEKYFSDVDSIYEFGCGTGHNLFRANEINPNANIFGLDWAESSQSNIKAINKIFNKNFQSHRFDFFNVDKEFKLERNSGIFTFAALEQVGHSHVDFINYLIEQNPQICIHVEPIGEMLNPKENLIDFLSVAYFEKRNYLKNLVNTLENLESSGRIEIINKKRSFIGSLYVDGYSIIIWKPVYA